MKITIEFEKSEELHGNLETMWTMAAEISEVLKCHPQFTFKAMLGVAGVITAGPSASFQELALTIAPAPAFPMPKGKKK